LTSQKGIYKKANPLSRGQGAIREVYEETNIKFEPWKLTHPIQTTCDGDPLFLFYAKIDQLIPVNLLSCASTFIDENRIRKPEVEAYYWLNPYTQIYLMQDRLIPGIKYYFKNKI
jgi:8-oxo-dGTP pyrophosphatase MutT (NUDIX family)